MVYIVYIYICIHVLLFQTAHMAYPIICTYGIYCTQVHMYPCIISDTPDGIPSLKFSKSPIAVNEDVEFTCKPEGDAGEPEADHFVYYESDSELYNGTSPWITQLSVVKDDVPFDCVMGNYVGTGDRKGSAELEVQGRCVTCLCAI